MTREWINYPISVIRAAAASTVGGLVTMMLALSTGTLLGVCALSGEFFWSPSDLAGNWALLLLCFVWPICVACLQLWGFLYLALVMWFAYQLIFDEAPRLRMAAAMLLPQFLCTLAAGSITENADDGAVWRSATIGAILLALWVVPFALRLRRGRPACQPDDRRPPAEAERFNRHWRSRGYTRQKTRI